MKNFLIGLIIGYVYIIIFFGFSIKCNTNNYYHINILNIHWHHWMISIIILLIFELLNNNFTEYIRGICIIVMLHGLYYEDCFDLSVKSMNKDKA